MGAGEKLLSLLLVQEGWDHYSEEVKALITVEVYF